MTAQKDDGFVKRRNVGAFMLITISLTAVAIISILAGYLFLDRGWTGTDSEMQEFASWRCLPEYERSMKRVVLSLAKGDTSLQLQDSLLAALPEYTNIILLLAEGDIEAVQHDLQTKPYRDQVQLVTYPAVSLRNSQVWLLFRDQDELMRVNMDDSCVESYTGNNWTQDLFEVATDSTGDIILLRSSIHKYWSTAGAKSSKHIAPDNAFLDQLSKAGMKIRTLPLAFMGGNIFIDEVDGRQIAFCGQDILKTTRVVLRAIRDASLSDSQAKALLKDALKVDRVIMLGTGQLQPGQMYHLDQAMVLLPDKVVAVAKIVGPRPQSFPQTYEIEEAEQFLVTLRSTLRSLGYRVVDIETSTRNILRCQHYVNAIPYVNAETGQRTLLMPIFDTAQTEFDKNLIKKNTATFESLGYEVVHVPTSADGLRGGIHCLINVID